MSPSSDRKETKTWVRMRSKKAVKVLTMLVFEEMPKTLGLWAGKAVECCKKF